jgi:2,4-dienoyl-CoA reductase-like NADH-dependent reductase (Old Yellow Enzyme family)
VEIIKAVRAAAGLNFPICVRVSQFKSQDFSARLANTPQELEAWLQPLVDAGADLLHCSQRRFWAAEFPEIDGESGLNLAGWAKKLTGAAAISVGSVGLSGDVFTAFAGESSEPASLDGLIARLEKEEFDLIAVGRALLGDAQWLEKIEKGELSQLQTFSPAAIGTLS